ncbi:unnamed protein product, partial [Closterium sp. NIES-54]
ATAPPIIQNHGTASLTALDSHICTAIGRLTSRRTRDLLLILSSQRFLDRLEQSLLQKKTNEARLLDSIGELERRRREIRTALADAWPKLEAVVQRTRAYKTAAEAALSAMYSNRPVHIIGEINNMLQATAPAGETSLSAMYSNRPVHIIGEINNVLQATAPAGGG